MKKTALHTAPPDIDSLIITVGGQKIILDADLARIHEVPTKTFNQAVKRNLGRVPSDFLFRLTAEEAEELNRSHSVPVL
jgi:hypothetical protein